MVAGLPDNSTQNESASQETKIVPPPVINPTRNNSQAETHDTSRNDISRFFQNMNLQTQRDLTGKMMVTSSSEVNEFSFEGLVSEGKKTREILLQKFKGLEVFIDRVIKDQVERKEYNIQKGSFTENILDEEVEVVIPNETCFDNKKAQVKFNVIESTRGKHVSEAQRDEDPSQGELVNKVVEFCTEIDTKGQVAKAEGELDEGCPCVETQENEMTQEKIPVPLKLKGEEPAQLTTKKLPKKGFNFRVNKARVELILQATQVPIERSSPEKMPQNNFLQEKELSMKAPETLEMPQKENPIEEKLSVSRQKTPKGFNFRVNKKKVSSLLLKDNSEDQKRILDEENNETKDLYAKENKSPSVNKEVETKGKDYDFVNSKRKTLQEFEKYEDFLGKIEGWKEEGQKLKGFNFRNPNRIKAD